LAILDDVTAIVAAQLERNPREFGPDTDLEDEGFTSLDLIEVVFVLEEKFGIDIKLNANDQDAKRRTIGDLARLVETLVERRAAV
jgi:acyl carrier protein